MHKECHYCGNTHHARCYRFYTKNNQQKFWICVFCMEKKGGARKVRAELDILPLSQTDTNFFKSIFPTQQNPRNNSKRNSWTPNEEFAKFKLKTNYTEEEW